MIRKHTRNGPEAPLIFGLDPLKERDARHIATNGEDHSPARRALAWRTLKKARGQTCAGTILAATIGLTAAREVTK